MPFSHLVSRSKLADLQAAYPSKVLAVKGTMKLLGILQGATITAETRFCQVILALRPRCAIWKYRARTLRGKTVLLHSIIVTLL